MKFEFKGLPAVLVGVAIVGFLAFRIFAIHGELETEAADALRQHLTGAYASKMLSVTGGDLSEKGEALLELQEIEFVSIRGRGSTRDMIVRRMRTPSLIVLSLLVDPGKRSL